jgi:hypothetical protein
LLDLQTAGTSRFAVDKLGQISTSVFGTSQSAISYGSGSFFLRGDGVFQSARFEVNGLHGRLDNLGLRIRSTAVLGFCSGDAVTTSSDTILARDSANTLAQRNGTNAQTFRLYNTFTDASNYERAFMRWNSNTLEIGTEAGGTGTNRFLTMVLAGASTPLVFGTGGGTSIFMTGLRGFSTTGGMTVGAVTGVTGSGGSTILGLTQINYTSGAADPTTSAISSGSWQVHRNTTSGVVKLWANNAGTLVSVALA